MKAFTKFTWQNYPNGSFQAFNLNIRLRRGSVKTIPLCEMNATCRSIARAGSSMCCSIIITTVLSYKMAHMTYIME